MKLKDYQAEAYKTAIYNKGFRVNYPITQLLEETGEVVGKVSKLIRDKQGVVTDEFREVIKKELGDVAWGIAAITTDIQENLFDKHGNEIQEEVLSLIPKEQLNVLIVEPKHVEQLLRLSESICSLSRTALKCYLADPFNTSYTLMLNNAIAMLSAIAGMFNLKLDDILEANIAKLKLRQEKNMLTGSGDNREQE